MVKIARLDNAFLQVFLTASKPSRRSITGAKRKEKKRRKRKGDKIQKSKKPKENFYFYVKRDPVVTKRASCRVASAFSTRLKLIWPRSSLKTTKMPKRRIFGKSLQESMG